MAASSLGPHPRTTLAAARLLSGHCGPGPSVTWGGGVRGCDDEGGELAYLSRLTASPSMGSPSLSSVQNKGCPAAGGFLSRAVDAREGTPWSPEVYGLGPGSGPAGPVSAPGEDLPASSDERMMPECDLLQAE